MKKEKKTQKNPRENTNLLEVVARPPCLGSRPHPQSLREGLRR